MQRRRKPKPKKGQAGSSVKQPRRLPPQSARIEISIREQRLTLKRGEEILRSYSVSSSRFGTGTEAGSFKTPTGQFRVAKKIGGDAPSGTIFRGRVALRPNDPLPATEDFVMSRILWLDGLDKDNANTRDRYIYIHGTKHEDKIGQPESHGCIRMRNADVIELFDLVDAETPVVIRE
jgi:lipoprotein-anchoring transpeptidase ErfK/SrfK